MQNITKQLAPVIRILKPIARQHVFITLLFVLGFIIFHVYTTSQILQLPSDEAYRLEQEASSTTRTSFDQTTIDQIRDLRRGNEGGNIDLGKRKRPSPFIE